MTRRESSKSTTGRSKGGLKQRGFWVACTMLLAMMATGCGGERRVPTFVATGTVVAADGSPVPHALVVLHPEDQASTVPKPRGTTDDQGRFQLSTYATNDGAPEGNFVVTLEQWYRDDPNDAPKNHLPPTLGKVESSGIRVAISKGENTLEPIQIR